MNIYNVHFCFVKFSSLLCCCRAEENPPMLECSLTRAAAKQKQNDQGDKTFEQYHDFKSSLSSLKAHQVGKQLELTINSGVFKALITVCYLDLLLIKCLW